MTNNNYLGKIIVLFLIVAVLIPPTMGSNAHITGSYSECSDMDVLFNHVDKESYNQYYKAYISRAINENNYSYKLNEKQRIYSFNRIVTNSRDDGLMDSCWPMKAQNTHHTGLSQYITENNNGNTIWTYQTPGWIEGGPVIDDEGVIYFGDFEGHLNALYPDGTLKWEYDFIGTIWSTPAIAWDGTIYIGTFGDSLYAIHRNGTLKWEYHSGGSICSSPVIEDDGMIYFGTMGPGSIGRVHAVFPNGTKNWHYDTGHLIVSDPAIANDGTIYMGSGDHYLYALNPDGTLKWRFKTGDIVKSHPSIADDGTIYFDSFDDYLYALNPDGTLKWKFQGVGCACASASLDEDGVIYLGGRNFDAVYPNGTRKWRFNFGDDIKTSHSSPAISADGTIYIGVKEGNMVAGYIYALDKETGALLWKRKISNDWVSSSPCIGADGTVYIGSSSSAIGGDSYGVLYAFGRNESNQAPNPPKIHGTTRGKPSISYTYNFTVDDPDHDQIELYIDWDDGSSEDWIGPYDSGSMITLCHTWTQEGTYAIHAKARDTYDGSESIYSTLSVAMPKNKVNEIHIYNWFIGLIQKIFYPFIIIYYCCK